MKPGNAQSSIELAAFVIDDIIEVVFEARQFHFFVENIHRALGFAGKSLVVNHDQSMGVLAVEGFLGGVPSVSDCPAR